MKKREKWPWKVAQLQLIHRPEKFVSSTSRKKIDFYICKIFYKKYILRGTFSNFAQKAKNVHFCTRGNQWVNVSILIFFQWILLSVRIIDFIQNNLEFHTLCEILATDGLFLEFHTLCEIKENRGARPKFRVRKIGNFFYSWAEQILLHFYTAEKWSFWWY